jgi:hypothetical protein
MPCHVYDSVYCKVITIVIRNMQFEFAQARCVMWTKLNCVMLKFGLANLNFKRFMADNAQAN